MRKFIRPRCSSPSAFLRKSKKTIARSSSSPSESWPRIPGPPRKPELISINYACASGPIRERAEAEDDARGVRRIFESYQEHHVADLLLDELTDLSPSDDHSMAKMKVLAQTLEGHMEHEERKLFSEAKEDMDKVEVADMGDDFAIEKQHLERQLLRNFELDGVRRKK